MRCPSCRTLVLGPATATTESGTLIACPRCPARWISRPGDETDLAASRPRPMIERGPPTIEGALAPPPPSRAANGFFGRRTMSLSTGTLMTGAMAAMLAFVAALTLSPGVSAGPDTKMPETGTMARTMEGNR